MSPDKKPTKPVDVYIRVSRVGVREGVSFQSTEQQEERCRAQLKADGLKAGEVFVDLDESGAKKSRPAFDKALARIEEGKSGGIIVYDLSRFGRSTRNVLDGIDWIESHGGAFISCAEKIDTSTSSGRFVLTVFAAIRQMERDQHAERWEVSKAKARARGVHIGAARAGYVIAEDGSLVEHPEYIEAVKEAFALRARGGSWKEAAEVLNSAGVPTSKGNTYWSRQAVQLVIRNRAYRGDPIPAWQWDKAQAKKGEPRVRGEGHVLGQGLCKCSLCGDSLFRTSNGRGVPMLRCGRVGGGHAAMTYEVAQDYILSLGFSHVGPQLRRDPGGDENERQALTYAVEEARAALATVEEQAGIKLPGGPLVQAVEDAEAALAEFEAQANAPLGLSDFLTPVGIRAEFEKLPIPEQRRVLGQIVSKVTVSPGRGKPGERITVEFTDGERWPAEPKVPPGDSEFITFEDIAPAILAKQAARGKKKWAAA